MTSDLHNLSLATSLPVNDTVQTASGEGLLVSHVGNSMLSSPSATIPLKSVLYVPHLKQNLMSVHRLCLDNNYRLIFDALCFWIQDKATGRLIFRGYSSDGLYPLPFASTSSSGLSPLSSRPQASLGQLILSSTWHSRLGHPTNKIVTLMLHKAEVKCPVDSHSSMCHNCLHGKFTKLPFISSSSKSVIPFQIVHSDVWGPSPCMSLDGYR